MREKPGFLTDGRIAFCVGMSIAALIDSNQTTLAVYQISIYTFQCTLKPTIFAIASAIFFLHGKNNVATVV